MKNIKNKIIVEEWEHDRWSGAEMLERYLFDTREEAVAFCEKINSQNTEKFAPDYYIEAHIV